LSKTQNCKKQKTYQQSFSHHPNFLANVRLLPDQSADLLSGKK
jgi:hypothetical protein